MPDQAYLLPETSRATGVRKFSRQVDLLWELRWYVERPEDIRPALERAAAATKEGKPALINVNTDDTTRANPGRFSRYMT